MMGRVAELGCGHAAHTAAHRAAEHAETDRHTHAAPHLSGTRAETDLPGPATPGTRPAGPDAAGQFGRGYGPIGTKRGVYDAGQAKWL